MNSIRVKFIRGEEVKFISHLDLMKTFERALRRSGLPIAYSQGFNPHPHMVFGLPLSVGVTSEAEYADFDLSSPVKPEEFRERLNGSLPKGLSILQAKEKNVKDNIMASISIARYIILVSLGQFEYGSLKNKVEEFMLKHEIIARKEGKKGSKDVDIRPMIYDIKAGILDEVLSGGAQKWDEIPEGTKTWMDEYIKSLYEGLKKPRFAKESIVLVSALLSAGSVANLKPELLVSSLEGFLSAPVGIVKIHRTELFVNTEGRTAEPLEDSVLNRMA